MVGVGKEADAGNTEVGELTNGLESPGEKKRKHVTTSNTES